MSVAATLPGFTRLSKDPNGTKPSGIVFETTAGVDRYIWVDTNGVIRTGLAATVEAGGFNFLTGGTIVGGGAAAAAIPDLSGSVGTANDAMTALTTLTDSPATADALRDNLTTNWQPEIQNNLADLQAKVNGILAALRTHGIVST